MVDQPNYLYFECDVCGFDSVQHVSFDGRHYCPLCLEDNGRDIVMSKRTARETDKPEGRDARKEKKQ